MRIIIDIGHPADFHLFKNFAEQMIEKNNSVLFTIREKDILKSLINKSHFEYVSYGKNIHSLIGKIFGLILFNLKLFVTSIKFKPDIFVSHSSMYAAQVSFILRKPCITLEDTGNKEQIRLYKPFTDVIITSECLKNQLGRKQIRVNSYHEIAYLHPDYFTPNKDNIKSINIEESNNIILLRFVARNASHDIGIKETNNKEKEQIVKNLEKFGKVLISSETPLPESIKKFEVNIPVDQVHHLIAYSNLVFGESATMASEAAILGIPSIFIDPKGRDYTNDLEENYKLVFNFSNSDISIQKALKKADEILSDKRSSEIYKERRSKMLQDKINLTNFLVWFVNDFPQSKSFLISDPLSLKKFIS